MKFEHILIPTDFSPLSMRPFEAAPEIFEGAAVTLLHVVENYHTAPAGSPFEPKLEDASISIPMQVARDEMSHLAAKVQGAKEIRQEVYVGPEVGRTVAEWAEDNGVDLIATSTQGRTGLRRFFLGSVTDRILRYATVPVLCFPPARDAHDD